MHQFVLAALLSVTILAMAGCGKEEANPAAAAFAKKPAFFRVFNAGATSFTMAVNGAAFGSEFTPGFSTALSRVRNRTATASVMGTNKSPIEISVPFEEDLGTTLFVLDPNRKDGYVLVQGDIYQAPEGEARLRGIAVEPVAAISIQLEGAGLLLESTAVTAGGKVIAVKVGAPQWIALKDAGGKELARTDFHPESGRSYSAIARYVRGRPQLEVLMNNPPLSPRGSNSFSNSN